MGNIYQGGGFRRIWDISSIALEAGVTPQMEFIIFILTIVAYIGIPSFLLVLPGWLYSRKRRSESYLTLFIPFAGLLFWFVLVELNYGQQSLGNIVELYIVAGVGISLVCLKVILPKYVRSKSILSKYTNIGLILFVTFVTRTFMPLMSE